MRISTRRSGPRIDRDRPSRLAQQRIDVSAAVKHANDLDSVPAYTKRDCRPPFEPDRAKSPCKAVATGTPIRKVAEPLACGPDPTNVPDRDRRVAVLIADVGV